MLENYADVSGVRITRDVIHPHVAGRGFSEWQSGQIALQNECSCLHGL